MRTLCYFFVFLSVFLLLHNFILWTRYMIGVVFLTFLYYCSFVLFFVCYIYVIIVTSHLITVGRDLRQTWF